MDNNNNNNIFRTKAVERVTSPEALDKYLKVTSPSVWMSLIAIIIILCGFIIWGVIGKIETTVTTGCQIDQGYLTCYVKDEDMEKVSEGDKIVVKGLDQEFAVTSLVPLGYVNEEQGYTYGELIHLVGAKLGDYIYYIDIPTGEKEGVYAGEIIIESLSPLEFILN